MAKFSLPVTWSVCGVVEVEAASLAEAIKDFDPTDHELPEAKEYVDGSFELTSTDADEVFYMTNPL